MCPPSGYVIARCFNLSDRGDSFLSTRLPEGPTNSTVSLQRWTSFRVFSCPIAAPAMQKFDQQSSSVLPVVLRNATRHKITQNSGDVQDGFTAPQRWLL